MKKMMKDYRKHCNKILHKKYKKQLWGQKLNITFKEYMWDYLCERTSFKDGEAFVMLLRIITWMIAIMELSLKAYGYAIYTFTLAIFNTCISFYNFTRKKKLLVFNSNLEENIDAVVREVELELLANMILEIIDGTFNAEELKSAGFTKMDIEDFEKELSELFDNPDIIEKLKNSLGD